MDIPTTFSLFYICARAPRPVCCVGTAPAVQTKKPVNLLGFRMHIPWPCYFSAHIYWKCCCRGALQANQAAVCKSEGSGRCMARADVGGAVQTQVVLSDTEMANAWLPLTSWAAFTSQRNHFHSTSPPGEVTQSSWCPLCLFKLKVVNEVDWGNVNLYWPCKCLIITGFHYIDSSSVKQTKMWASLDSTNVRSSGWQRRASFELLTWKISQNSGSCFF